MAKISIIIPVYNAEKYLKQCIDSILEQTLEDIEVICVDDGSTDTSVDILKEYAQKESRLCYITQKNQYAGVARNNGMKQATGEYLLFIDSDDFIEKELCRKTYEAATQCDADIVLFAADRLNEQTQERSEAGWYLNENMLPEADPFSRKDMDGNILRVSFLGPWNKLFRRSFVEKWELAFQPLHNSNDDYFVAMAMALAERITSVREPLTIHRYGLEGNLQSRKHTKPLCFLEAYEAVFDKLHEYEIYEEVEKGFVFRVLNDCVYHFKTMKGAGAKREICRALSEEAFTRMGLLEQKDHQEGVTLRNKRYIECMIEAWRTEQDCVLPEAEEPLFPNEYDYYAACWNVEVRMQQQYTDAEARIKKANLEKAALQKKLNQREAELGALQKHFLVRLDRKLRSLYRKFFSAKQT